MDEPGSQQCVFCTKGKDEISLINLNTSSLAFEDEAILNFDDLFRELLGIKLIPDQTASLCDDCKNLLIQFYIFKNNAKNCPLASVDDTRENIEKVKMFLEENENEEVSCLRYNKCLTLVPESKKSFIEIFKCWQPHVVLESISELPPAPKRREMIGPAFLKRAADERDAIPHELCKTEAQEMEIIDEPQEKEDPIEEEFLESYDENTPESMDEEEWLQLEIENSETTTSADGDVEWLCTHCEKSLRFLDVNEFRNHLLTAHLSYEQNLNESEASGEYESAFLIEPSEYQEEEEEEDDEKLQNKEIVALDCFYCSQCSFATAERDKFRMHQMSHVDERTFQTTRFERLLCVDCNYQFTNVAHYTAHCNGHQLYEVIAKHSIYPICCNMMFCDEIYLNDHRNMHGASAADTAIPVEGLFLKYGHRRSDIERHESVLLTESSLKCGHCLRKFHDEESCRLHQLIFHVTTLKCPVESRVFNGNQAFSIHMRNNHPELFGDDVKFSCSVCKKEFETLYDKLRHMKTCDKKRFACNHCDKKFSQKCYLMAHLRRVSGQTSVTCDVCQKVCSDKGDYEIHFRSHSNIKPFKCSICPKAYKTSSARAAHVETHRETPIDCMLCTVKFKSRRTFQIHMKNKHRKSHDDPPTPSGKVIAEEIVVDGVY